MIRILPHTGKETTFGIFSYLKSFINEALTMFEIYYISFTQFNITS